MKFKVFIILFFIFSLLPGISLAQNKVVVIPLIVDSPPPTVTSTTGRIWMDRNLGALRRATKAFDPDAYGSLYQWGRLTDGHEYRASGTISTTSPDDVPGHGYFITVNATPNDWRATQKDSLWEGASGINNPCPAGFRLPTETEWETEMASWVKKDAGGAFSSPLELVMGGSRYRNNGILGSVSSLGAYWGSTVDGIYASYLIFSSLSGSARVGATDRANGFSVRCIKD